MRTFEEIGDVISLKNGYNSLDDMLNNSYGFKQFILLREAAKLYAEEAIAEQRELCAENAYISTLGNDDYEVYKPSILNAPSPTLK